MIPYLLHSSILLIGSAAFYWIFLRKETFFSLNRWTLVISLLLSLTLPLITVPAAFSLRGSAANNNIFTEVASYSKSRTNISTPSTPSTTDNSKVETNKTQGPVNNSPPTITESEGLASLSLFEIISWIYFFGVLVFFLVFIVQLTILLTKMYSLNGVKTGKYRIVELLKDEAPYSFWNTIFINPSIYDTLTYEQIIEHEKLHIDQAHFVDKFLAELVVIVFWFNPASWILRNAITNNLEFLTDQSLLNQGMHKEQYQMSLLKVSVAQKPYNLTTNYNNSFLKNRIIMMNSKQSSVTSIWKYIFILPLFLFSVISLNAVKSTGYISSEMDLPAEKLKDGTMTTTLNNETPITPKKIEAPAPKKTEVAPSNPTKIAGERVLDLDPINKIANAMHGNLVLTYGSRQEIRVEGDDEIINNLNTEVKDGMWNIGFRKGYKHRSNGKSQKLVIHATLTDLESVILSGSGNIKTTNHFKVSGPFKIIESGSGNMDLKINASELKGILSGSGNVDISGQADDLDILLSGSGNFNASDMKSNTLTAKSSGSGNILVDVDDSITVLSHSGSGDIRYKGNPKNIQNKKKTGSGKIRAY